MRRISSSTIGVEHPQRAIQFVRATAGVGTALVGMKRVGHVEENATVARVPPVPQETLRSLFP